MQSNRLSVLRSLPSILALAFTAAIALVPGQADAQSPELFKKLNAPAGRVAENLKSATRLFTAYIDMTKSPQEVGPEFN